MKVSKVKSRMELRRTIDNLKNSGFSYQQSLVIVSVVNSMCNIYSAIEEPEERATLIETVVNECYNIGAPE